MVNPRYRPFNGNSRKPIGSKSKTIHPKGFDKFKVEVVFPEVETYIGSHIKSDLAGVPVSNKTYEKYYDDLIWV